MNKLVVSYCGMNCTRCEEKKAERCDGCQHVKGASPKHETCEIANCALNKSISFCAGGCPDFPCDMLKQYSSDKEHGDQPSGARINRLRRWRTTLIKSAHDACNPIGICGHHCAHCRFFQRCGGCQSDANFCSLATISEDRVCPNVSCAKKNQLGHCSQCSEMESCEKGYYSNTSEYAAKAAALFIRTYGEKAYAQALERAVSTGFHYPDDLDQAGNVTSAFSLLERYLISENK